MEQTRIGPSLDPFIKGSGNLLKQADQILKYHGYIRLKLLSDHKGVFSIEYPKFFLTANGYLYHKCIISSQKEIIYRAKIIQKDLVVYVGSENKFYIFNPEDIINEHWENERGYLLMYNWDIRLGGILQL
jgi:hypothetical protein